MNLKEIYKENLGRKYRNVIKINKEEIEVNSDPLPSIKKNKFPIILASSIAILILLVTFNKNLNTFAIVVAFLVFMIILAIFFNNYSIKCKKDVLSLKWNLQKFDIPYSHLKSVFLSRDFSGLDVFPMISYNIVIRYIDNLNFIKELTFPTHFLNPEELKDFLDNFVIEENEAEDCIKFERYKKFKKALKVLGFILFAILFAIIVYASFK